MIIANYNEAAVSKIITYFKGKGLNNNGIAGLLGNLYAESHLYSNNLQNTANTRLKMTDAEFTAAVDNGTYNFLSGTFGYGLAQWTTLGRRTNLYNYIKSKNVSIADLDAQIEFLYTELSTKYKSVLNELTSPTNTVRSCAEKVVCSFEVPAAVINGGTEKENCIVKRTQYSQDFYDIYLKEEKKMSDYIFTADEFVNKLVDVATKFKTLYIMGCFGAPMTASNKNRYTKNNSYNTTPDRVAMIKGATPDTFGFDCVGLVKGILWGWYGDMSRTYGGAGYQVNGVPDTDAKKMLNYCEGVTTNFNTIKKGEFLWMDGHCGVYGGQDSKGRHFVIESTPKWKNCVQISYLGNLGEKEGNCRVWTKHGRLKWIDYSKANSSTPLPTPAPAPTPTPVPAVVSYVVKKGDTLNKIAKAYNTSVDAIVKANNIKNPNLITVGTMLTIPTTSNAPVVAPAPTKPSVYTVVKGDNLTKIAKKFDMPLATLKKLNPQVKAPFYVISVGQKINLQ